MAARRRDVGLVRGRPAASRSATPAPTSSPSAPPPRPCAPSPTAPAGPGRRCSSIVGPAEPTAELWSPAGAALGPGPRGPRPPAADGHRPHARRHRRPTRYVRRIRKDEMDMIMPACVAMFTEEVGISPLAGDGGLLYQARVAELVGAGRSFARIENGKVVFKAEIGAATPQACQIQGVWVAPEYRGRGLSETGMAAVLRYALARRRPGRQPLRQRLQHRGPRRLPPRRLPGGRRLHERAVLSAGRAASPGARRMPHCPEASPGLPRRRRSARSTSPPAWTRRWPSRPLAFGLDATTRSPSAATSCCATYQPRRPRPRRDHRRGPARRLRLRHAQRPHPLVVHRRRALPARGRATTAGSTTPS